MNIFMIFLVVLFVSSPAYAFDFNKLSEIVTDDANEHYEQTGEYPDRQSATTESGSGSRFNRIMNSYDDRNEAATERYEKRQREYKKRLRQYDVERLNNRRRRNGEL